MVAMFEGLRRLLGRSGETVEWDRPPRPQPTEYPLWWVRALDEPVRHGIKASQIGQPADPGGYLPVCGRVMVPAASDLDPLVARCGRCAQWARDHVWESPAQAPWNGDEADEDFY
ncbi:hypothetical protein [Actinoalloteichus hymeniacidonis]|uniref:Uncharacterized protein n=1 Tax=Actinoalloteichus hymeniacidonis TaxID=340345 RepID=A0AAC9MWF3_9PSEU|nr:hypothetical protein [Actinoalloteichus hymeniacidonis]AOS62158.1 hypothetical protein TL08_06670 [Actinoalloteichus hymeniacidonis]MBB5909820.1 hypothetical protein [Actinoalloteichus hymeniacidonis]